MVECGAFVTILPGLDGLLPPSMHALPGIYGHVSELAHHRVANPADEVSEGQEVMVKCIGIDEKSGKIKLSRKALIPKPEGAGAEPEGDAPPPRMTGPAGLGLLGGPKITKVVSTQPK
ncbi:MAG: S1 RNA-binding domain-containing protein [Holophaga sp.]|nr:S1 RNA-binding domain-containing protein [Holophaga sp.]